MTSALRRLARTGSLGETLTVAGGSGGESVCQPAWDPASGRLYFVSDRSGWYNIYVVEEDGSTRSEGLWA